MDPKPSFMRPPSPERWPIPKSPSEDGGSGSTFTLISGLAGIGKTRLAATWPVPFGLDCDGTGMASARLPYLPIRRDATMISALLEIVRSFMSGKVTPEGVTATLPAGSTVTAQSLIVDPLDAIQSTLKPYILGNRTKMTDEDWGVILEAVRPLVDTLRALPMHVVCVCHAQLRLPRAGEPFGSFSPTLQGGIKQLFTGVADVVLSGLVDENDNRIWYAAPMVTLMGTKRVQIMAKDRHGYLTRASDATGKSIIRNGAVTLRASATGYPSDVIARAITMRGKFVATEEVATMQSFTPEAETPAED